MTNPEMSEAGVEDSTQSKTCTTCQEVKSLQDFHVDAHAKSGRTRICKTCARQKYLVKTADRREASRQRLERELLEHLSGGTKRCTTCSASLPFAQFHRAAWSRDGRQDVCKSCAAEYHRNYRLREPDKYRSKTQRRRAARAGAHIGKVDLESLWNGICGICGLSLDPQLQYPHPLSKSLDHIEPIAAGGVHAQENLQWAHLACNSRKGAKSLTAVLQSLKSASAEDDAEQSDRENQQ